jgi:hypothetical protein
MKKFFVSVLLLLAFVGFNNLNAQFKQGDFEFGFGGTGGWEKASYISSIELKYVSLSLIPGYYVIDGLSIEPEIGMTFMEKIKPAFSLIGNVSYTFLLPKAPIGIFARVGYGITNSSNTPGDITYYRGWGNNDANIFNLGAGAKFLLDPKVYIRSEILYRNIKWKVSEESTTKFIVFLIGLGIVL